MVLAIDVAVKDALRHIGKASQTYGNWKQALIAQMMWMQPDGMFNNMNFKFMKKLHYAQIAKGKAEVEE